MASHITAGTQLGRRPRCRANAILPYCLLQPIGGQRRCGAERPFGGRSCHRLSSASASASAPAPLAAPFAANQLANPAQSACQSASRQSSNQASQLANTNRSLGATQLRYDTALVLRPTPDLCLPDSVAGGDGGDRRRRINSRRQQ